MATIYKGTVVGPMKWRVHVEKNGRRQTLNPRLNLVKHSPSGFSWGYAGSGPAQLAFALLCDAVGAERARPLYQRFKFEKIAPIGQSTNWEMQKEAIVGWVEEHEGQ